MAIDDVRIETKRSNKTLQPATAQSRQRTVHSIYRHAESSRYVVRVREAVGGFLLDVPGELAASECRQAGCVTPTVRPLLVRPYCPKAVLGDTETTQDDNQNNNIYWRGSIGQEHIATTSPQR